MENVQPSRPEDHDAAMALIIEHPLLKDDPITKRAVEQGIDANDNPLKDLAEFVQARGAFLELTSARDRLRNLRDGDPELLNSVVTSSVRPDLEHYLN